MVLSYLTKELFEPGRNGETGQAVIGELDGITKLVVHDGTISTVPVNGIRYSNVREMRVYGDHKVSFPREGISFFKDGERPVESVSVEEHPQNLIVRGVVRPSYKVRDMEIDLGSYMAEGPVIGSMLAIRSPIDFSIWAEYISDEELALLKNRPDRTRQRKLAYGKVVDMAGKALQYVAISAAAPALYLLVNTMVDIVPKMLPSGIFYSLSPNVKLVFPDGRVDKNTGAQVLKFNGEMLGGAEQRMETDHHGGAETLYLPKDFVVDGDFSVEGSGISYPYNNVSGRLDFSNGRAYLVGNVQA